MMSDLLVRCLISDFFLFWRPRSRIAEVLE